MNVNARGDVIGPGGAIVTPKETVIKKYYEQPKGMVSDTPRSKTKPAPKAEPVKTVQKMTPVAAKPAPKKTVAPKVVSKSAEAKPVESTTKKGIDAALDGLE
jgi:hypothetical protein